MVAEPAQRTELRLGALLPAVAGLAISIYLSIEHYTAGAALACPDSGTINCAKVTTSSYAKLTGVPVAVAGAAYFLAMCVLVMPPAWRISVLRIPRLIAAGTGVAFIIYLIWAELFAIDAICLWCTGAHLCALALFIGILWYTLGDS